jgi:hypothetical protein
MCETPGNFLKRAVIQIHMVTDPHQLQKDACKAFEVEESTGLASLISYWSRLDGKLHMGFLPSSKNKDLAGSNAINIYLHQIQNIDMPEHTRYAGRLFVPIEEIECYRIQTQD